jgi:hypothetical protein
MKRRDAFALLSLALVYALVPGLANAQGAAVRRTECLGYQTIGVPGDIEYATLPPNMSSTNGGGYGFDTGAGAWKTYQLVDSEGVFRRR